MYNILGARDLTEEEKKEHPSATHLMKDEFGENYCVERKHHWWVNILFHLCMVGMIGNILYCLPGATSGLPRLNFIVSILFFVGMVALFFVPDKK